MKTRINGKTRLIALLGDPVDHSISPLMHNTAFESLGLNYAYMAFSVRKEHLPDAVNAMKTLSVAGFNVTMPNKEAIVPLLDEVSEEAELIGAVNTVKNSGGKLKGYNTDGMGYIASLREENVEVEHKKFLIAGAGGAARSIAIQLALEGAAEITILSRRGIDGEEICSMIGNHIATVQAKAYKLQDATLEKELRSADVFINCTPLGMHPKEDQSIITDPGILRPDLVVSDIIYAPPKTRLLKIAEEAGCKTINGTGMILGQGALAFEIWTGKKMPTEAIKETAVKLIRP